MNFTSLSYNDEPSDIFNNQLLNIRNPISINNNLTEEPIKIIEHLSDILHNKEKVCHFGDILFLLVEKLGVKLPGFELSLSAGG